MTSSSILLTTLAPGGQWRHHGMGLYVSWSASASAPDGGDGSGDDGSSDGDVGMALIQICRFEAAQESDWPACIDMIDNDCDGLIDTSDPDCNEGSNNYSTKEAPSGIPPIYLNPSTELPPPPPEGPTEQFHPNQPDLMSLSTPDNPAAYGPTSPSLPLYPGTMLSPEPGIPGQLPVTSEPSTPANPEGTWPPNAPDAAWAPNLPWTSNPPDGPTNPGPPMLPRPPSSPDPPSPPSLPRSPPSPPAPPRPRKPKRVPPPPNA